MKFDINTYKYPKFLKDAGFDEIEGHYPVFNSEYPSDIFYFKNESNFKKLIFSKCSIDYYVFKHFPDIKYYQYVKLYNMDFKDISYTDFEARRKSNTIKILENSGLIPKSKPAIKKIA